MAAGVRDITKVKRPGLSSWPLMARYPPPGIWPKLFDYGSTVNAEQVASVVIWAGDATTGVGVPRITESSLAQKPRTPVWFQFTGMPLTVN